MMVGSKVNEIRYIHITAWKTTMGWLDHTNWMMTCNMIGSLDSMERGMVEWNSGMVE